MFFEIFKQLSQNKNTTPTAVIKELGLSTSKITAWKNGSIPNLETASKIADYFSVTTDYLLTGKEPLPNNLTFDQKELLSLWDKLDPIKQAEFKGELKGYIRAREEK